MTPDVERLPCVFDAERTEDQGRLRRSELLLVSGARAAALMAPVLPRGVCGACARLWAGHVTDAVRLDLQLSGADGVDWDRQYVVMSLHESFVDVPVLLQLPIDPVFTVRQELLSHERFGGIVRHTGQIPVPETTSPNAMRRFRMELSRASDAGQDVVVFPQGSVLGLEVAFESGVRSIARHLGLPVLPVSVTGTHRVWDYPFDTTVRFDQTVELSILEPIEPADLTPTRLREAEQQLKGTAQAASVPARRFDPDRDGWWDDYAFEIDPDFPELTNRLTAHRAMATQGSTGRIRPL